MSRRVIPVVVVVLALLAIAGCSDGDSQGGGTSTGVPTPTSTGTPTTSSTATSAAPTTTDAPTTTTSPPTTAVDVEALKRAIAADYERAFYRGFELSAHPSLRKLDARVAEVAVRGSPAFEALVNFIQELVANGDRAPQDPDVLWVDVERVELVGEPPYTRARLQTCEVFETEGQVQVLRVTNVPVRLTGNGWLRTASDRTAEGFPGERRCP